MSEDASEAVRGILGKWAASLPGHPHADFAQKVILLSVEERPSFVVRLMTLFDARGDAKPCVIPVKEGEPPPPTGDIWAVPAGLEDDFYRHETRLSVALSAEPASCAKCEGGGLIRCKACAGTKRTSCPACTGKGKKNCPECQGLGKLACASCKGKGMVLASVSHTGRDQESACQACHGTGGPPCPRCGDPNAECETCKNERFVPCEPCSGKGGVACAECAGAGKVLKGKSYLVEYQPLLERGVKLDPLLPEGLLPKELPKEDLGKIVFDKVEAKFDAAADGLSEPGLKELSAEVLARGEAGKKKFSGEARIIKQRLSVDRIPSYFVVYEYAGKRYLCWATTLGGKVVATESPFSEHAGKAGEEARKAQEAAKAPAGPSGFALSVALAGGATLLLAALNRSSHNLFWPSAVFFAALLGLLKGASLLAARRKGAVALALGPAVAALATLGTLAAQPFRRLDVREFEAALDRRFPAGLPESFTPEDEAYLKAVTALYAPVGVDTSGVEKAVAESAQRAAAAAAAARAEAEAKAEADRRAAEEEAKKKREKAALANAIRFSKASKPARPARKKKAR